MELLCIETHPKGVVKAGNCYPLVSDKCPCRCDAVDVGIRDNGSRCLVPGNIRVGQFMTCNNCGATHRFDGIWWLNRSRFAVVATEEEVQEKQLQNV